MANITGRDLVALERQVKSSRASARRYREKAGEAVSTIQRTVTVAATCGGLAWLAGRYGERVWFSMSQNLWVGFGGHLLAMWDVGDGMSPVFANIGDGGIAAWAYTRGEMAGKKPAAVTGGFHEGGHSRGLSDPELDRLVAAPV